MQGFDGLVLGVVVGVMSCGTMCAQESALPDAPTPQVERGQDLTLRGVPMAVLKDQRAIWTSPARIRTKDLIWLAPLAAATGAALATDHHTLSTVVSHDASFNGDNVNASNALIGGFIAAPAALFAVGHYEQNEKARETGLLGAEALADAVAVEQGMKLVFWRERPALDHSRGLFFQSGAGWDSSFPSSHATLAWSSAAVIADEYRSPWVQVGVYTLATGVSLTRVMGQEHFPTDVLVGSAAGWLVGHYVARSHRRHEAGRR
jgi:membrane-associated phospholipid phosphatase